MACEILDPWPGIEPLPSAVEMQSLDPGTAREVPLGIIFDACLSISQTVSKSYWHHFKMHPNRDLSGSSGASTLCSIAGEQVQSLAGGTMTLLHGTAKSKKRYIHRYHHLPNYERHRSPGWLKQSSHSATCPTHGTQNTPLKPKSDHLSCLLKCLHCLSSHPE